jgi:hypothetical protein
MEIKPVNFLPITPTVNSPVSSFRSPINTQNNSFTTVFPENVLPLNQKITNDIAITGTGTGDTNSLQILSFSEILDAEIPAIKGILKQFYSIGSDSQLIDALKKDQKDLFSKCKNNFTSGGIPVVSLNQFNGLSSEDNYCFDIADIANRFENGNFINPFTGKFFSDDFIRKFQTKIRTLYARNISFSNITNLIHYDTIQRLKLKLILKRSGNNDTQANDTIKKFFSLNDNELNIFISKNLKASPVPIFKTFQEKQKYAIDNWILMSWEYLNEQTKAKTTGPFSFLFG